MFIQDLTGFIRGNQVIRLQRAEGGRCNNQFARSSVQAKYRRQSSRFHKHKIEPKHVFIRLEMLSNTYLSVLSIQMDIFRQQIP